MFDSGLTAVIVATTYEGVSSETSCLKLNLALFNIHLFLQTLRKVLLSIFIYLFVHLYNPQHSRDYRLLNLQV